MRFFEEKEEKAGRKSRKIGSATSEFVVKSEVLLRIFSFLFCLFA